MKARATPATWLCRFQQLLAITQLELSKCFLNKMFAVTALLNLLPLAVVWLVTVSPGKSLDATPTDLSQRYAIFFSNLILRISVFFTAALLSIRLLRSEMLEKTMHYYLLAPVRREIVALGKFLAASLASSMLCSLPAAGAYLAVVSRLGSSFGAFFWSGPGRHHLAAYLGVTILGCFGYCAVFVLVGLLFRSPVVAGLVFLGWESALFLMPPALKAVTVRFYLEALLPYHPPAGALAVLADPPSPLVSLGGLLAFIAAVLALAGWRARRLEIAYSTD